MKTRISLSATLALLAVCIPGQAEESAAKPSWNPFNKPKVTESKYAVPARLAILWSPAVLNQAGKTPTRGFGGRIYFYDAKNKPVSVEGQLVVYAYNNDKPNPDSKVPDRKYAFTPEQFTRHYTPTELGPSYSVWIPWDTVGQPQAEISLVPVFTSASGALVMGQPSRNLLPGPKATEPKSYVTNCTVPGGELQPLSPQNNLQQPPGGPGFGGGNVQQASYVSQNYSQMAGMAAPGQNAAGQYRAQQLPPGQFQPAAPVQPAGLGAFGAAPGVPQFQEQGSMSTMSINLPGTMSDRLSSASPQQSAMQRMAALRQEALARQGGMITGSAGPLQPPVPNATGLGGVPQPWFPGQPQPARSGSLGSPAPAGPTLPQAVGPPPSQQFPAIRQSAPPGSL